MSAAAICDVGPRDGLQNEPVVLDPAVRAELVDRLAGAGVRRIEVASFVHPDRVPAMAGAEEVVKLVTRRHDVAYAGLVLNERGYDRLLPTGLDEARMVVACTDTFSRRNAGAPLEEVTAAAERIVRRAKADGLRVAVALAVTFGCPFEGRVPESAVLRLAERLAAAGPDEISLADTIGVAGPREVRRIVAAVSALGLPVAVHFHHTRNTAVVNSYAALEAGAATLESGVGGTGGCPFAPGAQGNLATEDLVYLLERDGFATGIDLDAMIATARWLQEQLGRPLPSHLLRAGTG